MSTQRIIIKVCAAIVIVYIITNLGGCSSAPLLTSYWHNQEIKIDGDPAEWLPVMQQIPDKKVSVAFKNDNKFLYLCLMTEDRSKIFQIMRGGLIVWYETESNEYKTYGVRYPLPVNFSEQMPGGKEGTQGEGGKDLGQRENLERFVKNFFQKQNELEVINKDKFPLTALQLPNNEGTEARFGTYRGMLVYELKVPLAVGGDYSFSAGAVPGEKLKIRFETESNYARAAVETGDQGQRGQRPGSGGMGGGMGGGRGGMRGGGMRTGGMMGGTGSQGNIDFAVEIKLDQKQVNK